MMEIDPRYTKDGQIVLHHDASLERTTNAKGLVADFTLHELKQLRLRDPDGKLTNYSMPSLDEALEWARGKTILVLDQKTVPIGVRVKKIETHAAEPYAILIVYSLKDAKKCYAMNKNIMMEVMITDREKFSAFDKTGIPWSNIIAFVGHSPPRDSGLYSMIHAKGTRCIAGTSRNLDRQFINRQVAHIEPMRKAYHGLMDKGIDLIETDIPREVGQLLYGKQQLPQMGRIELGEKELIVPVDRANANRQ
jgi:glycerophosphoryl diester phosphodiesterase